MAPTDNRRPPTMEAWVFTRVSPCRICGGQSDTGTGLLKEFFGFPRRYHSIRAPHTHHVVEENSRFSVIRE
jgi:hypothetical protein